MIKEYYEIKTYMHFEKTVLVPVDEVEDEYEAKELVSKAVEVSEIDLLGSDADCGEICKGTIRINDSLLHNFDNQIIHKEKIIKKDINIKDTAQAIVDVLESCGFDNITDSSGYYIIKEFEDGTDRAVDVYKSTGEGTEAPHYVIYISYEDDNSDWEYTDGLSVEELEKKLEELSQ